MSTRQVNKEMRNKKQAEQKENKQQNSELTTTTATTTLSTNELNTGIKDKNSDLITHCLQTTYAKTYCLHHTGLWSHLG